MNQIINNKQGKKFNLEERTLTFSKKIIQICKKLVVNTVNKKLIDQLIRSACSIGANYREANDTAGKKDFIYKLRIARREAKETTYWLELIQEANLELHEECNRLIEESLQLRNILSAIITNSYQK